MIAGLFTIVSLYTSLDGSAKAVFQLNYHPPFFVTSFESAFVNVETSV
jgi:hypothetical protein